MNNRILISIMGNAYPNFSKHDSVERSSNSILKNYLKRAADATAEELIAIIMEVVNEPDLFHFGELLDLPNVQIIRDDAKLSKYYSLLEIFAFGTYSDYVAKKEHLPKFSDCMLEKIRLLSLISLTSGINTISYDILLEKLELQSFTELENLIISAFYKNLIMGRMDSSNKTLCVSYAVSRDLRREDIPVLIEKMKTWSGQCQYFYDNVIDEADKVDALKPCRFEAIHKIFEKIQKLENDNDGEEQKSADQ
ncbi:COP9 signalosome complex subunit 7 [Trichinella nativa]|uniref:COP9 signalosome complex subunit 7 n=5 Tax=Trichinella TaxID=6333 RepID=A0A0V1KVW8_9BILA|nr:COP9 signalosome complex subunit 7 [Trichinella nativa]